MTKGKNLARAVDIWHSLPLRGWLALMCLLIGLGSWIYLGFAGHPFYGALACALAVGKGGWIISKGRL